MPTEPTQPRSRIKNAMIIATIIWPFACVASTLLLYQATINSGQRMGNGIYAFSGLFTVEYATESQILGSSLLSGFGIATGLWAMTIAFLFVMHFATKR